MKLLIILLTVLCLVVFSYEVDVSNVVVHRLVLVEKISNSKGYFDIYEIRITDTAKEVVKLKEHWLVKFDLKGKGVGYVIDAEDFIWNMYAKRKLKI